jgi:aspartyl-tRNA synthetase
MAEVFKGHIQNIKTFKNIIFLEVLINFTEKTFLTKTLSSAEIPTKYSYVEISRIKEKNSENYIIKKLKTLNEATPLINFDVDSKITHKLENRVLDIRVNKSRREALLIIYKIKKARRQILEKDEFIEIETPILTHNSGEGSHQFKVLGPNNTFFYLRQSPQIFKQMLMTAGVSKYYQFAKCFRDEDLRENRQFEFTQLDVEIANSSFLQIQKLSIKILKAIRKRLNIKRKYKTLTLSYSKVLKIYGLENTDIILSIRYKNGKLSCGNQYIHDTAFTFFAIKPGYSKTQKRFGFICEPNDLLATISTLLSFKKKDAPDSFLFITGYPQFEIKNGQKIFSNSPFNYMKKNGNTESYDLVLNSTEVLSGAKRENNFDAFARKYRHLNQEVPENLEYFHNLMKQGMPDSMGFAFGIERIRMALQLQTDIKPFIFGRRTKKGYSYLDKSPHN